MISVVHLDYENPMEHDDEYERLGRQMDELAREFGRTRDEKVRLQIEALSLRLAEIARGEKFFQ